MKHIDAVVTVTDDLAANKPDAARAAQQLRLLAWHVSDNPGPGSDRSIRGHGERPWLPEWP